MWDWWKGGWWRLHAWPRSSQLAVIGTSGENVEKMGSQSFRHQPWDLCVNYHYFSALTVCLKCWPNKKTIRAESRRSIYLFAFAGPSPSDVLQIKEKVGESFARGKTSPRPSFLSVTTPPPPPSSSFFFFIQVPYWDFDKWQCKKRIYVGSRRLAHYHKQNRALGPRHRGAIGKVFGCDAWVKTHFWRSGNAVVLGPAFRAALGEPGEDTRAGRGAFSQKAHSGKERGTAWLPEDLRAEWFKATCRKCLWLYCFLVSLHFRETTRRERKKKKQHSTDLPFLQLLKKF